MSSYWAAYYGDALVMSKKEFDSFLEHYAGMYGLDANEMFEEESVNEYGFICSKNADRTFEITEVSTDSCEGMYFIPFMHEGTVNKTKFADNGDIIQAIETRNLHGRDSYVVYADKNRFYGDGVFSSPYASYQEMKQEFMDKLEKYLPEDFDWDAHIGAFSYAQYA